MIQQLLLSEKSKNMQSHIPMLETPAQHYKIPDELRKQFPIPQSKKLPSQLVLPHNCQRIGQHSTNVPILPVPNGGICARRLMYYLCHLRRRSQDNDIAYWRKFVNEYYAPGSKKRWCLSSYENVGSNAYGIYSKGALGSWKCDLCGSKSAKGFEATFEVLPRLYKLKFENGVSDELLYLDFPMETELPFGYMMLQYDKAVLETVYQNSRVAHEGKLHIIFTQDLKIISWAFCTQQHEDFVLHRLIAPQVNQLIEAAQKYQKSIQHSSYDGELLHALFMNNNGLLKAGNLLARTVELPLVNDLGFSKHFVRFLQVSDVVNCMKDLMTYSLNSNLGPIESLNRYSQKEETIAQRMTTCLEERAPYQHSQFGGLFSASSGTEANRDMRSFGMTNDYQKLLLGFGNSSNIIPSKPDFYGFPAANSKVQAGREKPFLSNLLNYHQKPRPKHSSNSSSGSTAVKPISSQSLNSPVTLLSFSSLGGFYDSVKYAERQLLEEMFNCGAVQQVISGVGSGNVMGDSGPRLDGSDSAGGGHGMEQNKNLPKRGPRSSSSTRAQPLLQRARGKMTDVRMEGYGTEGLNPPSIARAPVKEEPLDC